MARQAAGPLGKARPTAISAAKHEGVRRFDRDQHTRDVFGTVGVKDVHAKKTGATRAGNPQFRVWFDRAFAGSPTTHVTVKPSGGKFRPYEDGLITVENL
jgi:hypothetical protein